MGKSAGEPAYYPEYWIDYSHLDEPAVDNGILDDLEVDHLPGTVAWLPCGPGNDLAGASTLG